MCQNEIQCFVGDITGEDVYYVLPFGNTVDRVTMTGAGMKAQIEEFMADLCPTADCYGTFLQVWPWKNKGKLQKMKNFSKILDVRDAGGL